MVRNIGCEEPRIVLFCRVSIRSRNILTIEMRNVYVRHFNIRQTVYFNNDTI